MAQKSIFVTTCLLFLVIAVAAPAQSSDTTPDLVAAIASGDARKLAELLSSGSDPNARAQGGITLLMGASYKGNEEIANLLLEQGAKVNVRSEKGVTALMLAAYNNHPGVVKILVGYGSDANMRDDVGNTAFQMAAMQGHADVAEILRQFTKGVENWRIKTLVGAMEGDQKCLTVTEEPEVNSDTVGCLKAGREVTTSETSPDNKWIRIRKPVSGWVPVEKLKKEIVAQAQANPVRRAAPQPTEDHSPGRDSGAGGSGALDSPGSGPADGAWWRRGQ